MRRNTSIYEVDRDSRNLYSPLCWGLVWLLLWKRIWRWWTNVDCWSAHCYALADGKIHKLINARLVHVNMSRYCWMKCRLRCRALPTLNWSTNSEFLRKGAISMHFETIKHWYFGRRHNLLLSSCLITILFVQDHPSTLCVMLSEVLVT